MSCARRLPPRSGARRTDSASVRRPATAEERRGPSRAEPEGGTEERPEERPAPRASGWPVLGPVLALGLGACGPGGHAAPLARIPAAASPAPAAATTDFHVPPPFTEGVFPCTDCHDPEIPVNTARRPMQAAHQEIVLEHDSEHRWCLDCHDAANRDVLHLAGGEPVPFEESYRLCGQCHGDKYRDWRAGVHGRRTGSWDGAKQYLLCVACHNAHSPAFRPLEPMPAPRAPQRTP